MKADKVLFTSATKKYSLKNINVERFSTYRKLICTTAVVLKFVRILRRTCSKLKMSPDSDSDSDSDWDSDSDSQRPEISI